MARIGLGVNMEFVRSADKSFEWGVEKAAALGYDYVEPMVHWGRELLSEAGYFHSVSMLDDPFRVKRACEQAGIKLSGLSAHTPLCKPDISTDYLKQAVRFAAECGIPMIETSHEISENPGLRHFAAMLTRAFPAINVRFHEVSCAWEVR